MSTNQLLSDKKQEHQCQYLTNHIECKSILTSAVIGEQTSTFAYAKKGLVRLISNFIKRSYVLDLYLHNKKCAISINLDKKFTFKFKTDNKIDITAPDVVVKLELENNQLYKTLESVLVMIQNESEEEFMCSFDTSLKSIQPVLDKSVKIESVINKRPCLSQLKIEPNQPFKVVKKEIDPIIKQICETYDDKSIIPNSKFYSTSNKTPQAVHKSRVETTENVLGCLSRDLSPIVIRTLNAMPGSPVSVKRKRDENELSSITKALTCKKLNNEIVRKYDFENQENENAGSPIKSWNRKNSINNKQCGKGFSNLGNTCYMNAILQCLLNIDLFSLELIQTFKSFNIKEMLNKQRVNPLSELAFLSGFNPDEETDNQEMSLYKCMCDLINARNDHNESLQVQSLKEIKNAISKEATRFSGYQQHDAHEFLCQVLDQLKDDIDKLNIKEPTKKFPNPVVDNFQFEVKHTIHCQKCNNELNKLEEYNNLCLEMPLINNLNKISLQDTLDLFFQDEHLDDFKCETCKNIEHVTIKRQFAKLPRILILHLKRYQFQECTSPDSDQPSYKLIKNDSDIQIPRYLTVKLLTSSETQPVKPVVKQHKFIAKKPDLIMKRAVLGERNINSHMHITPGFTIPKLVKGFDVDELPTLDLTVQDQIYNHFNPENLSEEKQLAKALELSLNEEKLMNSMMKPSILGKEMNDFNNPKFLDGVSYVEPTQEDNPADLDFMHPLDKKSQKLKTYGNKSKKKSLFQMTKSQLDDIDELNKKPFKTGIKMRSKQNLNENEVEALTSSYENDDEIKRAIEESLKFAENEKTKFMDFEQQIDDPFLDQMKVEQTDSPINKSEPVNNQTEQFCVQRTDAQNKMIYENSKTGTQPDSYRIIGIVNHLGVSSNSGHYISDALNMKTNQWSSFDDIRVEILTEEQVLTRRSDTGYIFFYIHNYLVTKDEKS